MFLRFRVRVKRQRLAYFYIGLLESAAAQRSVRLFGGQERTGEAVSNGAGANGEAGFKQIIANKGGDCSCLSGQAYMFV